MLGFGNRETNKLVPVFRLLDAISCAFSQLEIAKWFDEIFA